MDDRKLTVCYGRGNYKQAPPQIVLQGIWLEKAGFSAGDKITVATAGSAKPRRKACSTGRASGWAGAWGNPNKRAGISQKDIPAHCLPTIEKFTVTQMIGNTAESNLHYYTLD